MVNKVYTTREVGKFCGVDLTTVINWSKTGKLKAYKTAGGHRRINHKDLLEFMKKYSIPVPIELMGKGSLNVMIIGDDQQVLNALNDTFNKLYLEYKLIYAEDYFDIGYKLATLKPDIIIVDSDAKSVNVDKVIKKICDTGENEKIIALRRAGSDSTSETLEKNGADIVIQKPLDPEKLEQAITGTER